MSQGQRVPSDIASRAAALAAGLLRKNGAASVEVAGSLRRGRPEVGDIELVCTSEVITVEAPLPVTQLDLFAAAPTRAPELIQRAALLDGLDRLVELSDVNRNDAPPTIEGAHVSISKAVPPQWGNRYRKAVLTVWEDVVQLPLDIFVADAANLGWILLLRTGSADFNQWLLHVLKTYGALSEKGRLWRGTSAIETPTEQDVFALAGMVVVPPEERHYKSDETETDARRRWWSYRRKA